jgi:inosine/xanthosine triphosphatase
MAQLVIALGSTRAAKVAAVRAVCAGIAEVDAAWRNVEIIARSVETDAPAMPLSDEELMRGARARAHELRAQLAREATKADLFIGLEGGFHTVRLDNSAHTFLRSWAYATDGARASYGLGPSIIVPAQIARRVTETGRELGEVIDEVAGERDVRSRQGAWGVLSSDLLTRADSFAAALVAACAPFYNARLYEG